MAKFFLGSKLTWEQYLQVSSFVKDIKGQIRRSGKAEKLAITEQTRQIVASREALVKKFGTGIQALSGTLDGGFAKLEQAIQGNTAAIEALRASFDYNLALVVEQLQIQNQSLLKFLDRMEAIHATLQNPILTQAREFFRIGCDRLVKGLLDKALEAFLESEKKDDTNFMTQLVIGKLYLYGVNEECSVVDLAKAEQHLKAAARFARAEAKLLPDANRYAGEALLHAAISCYAQANESAMRGDKSEAWRLMRESLSLSGESSQIYPRLSESHYHHAKVAALIGDGKTAAAKLEQAVALDSDYCLKAENDLDFRFVREEVAHLFQRLRQDSSREVLAEIRRVEMYLTDWIYVTEAAKKAESDIRQILRNAKTCQIRNTYFDNRDAMQLVRKAERVFQSLLVHSHPLRTLTAHSRRITHIEYGPDNSLLATAGVDQAIRLWDLGSNQLRYTLSGHAGTLTDMIFSHNGATLVTVDNKGSVRLWEVATGKLICGDFGPGLPVRCLAFSPDDTVLAMGDFGHQVTLWDAGDGSFIHQLEGHRSSVDTLVFDKDGSLLATGSPDNVALLWDLNEGELLHKFEGCSGLAHSLAFSRDGKTLICGGSDGSVRLHRLSDGELVDTLPENGGQVSSLALSHSGTLLAVINHGRALHLWQLPSGKLLHRLTPFSPGVVALQFSPDDNVLAARDYEDSSVKLWTVQDGRLAYTVTGNLTAFAFSPDGKLMVTGDEMGSLRFWGRMVRSINEPETTPSSPDKGNALAARRATPSRPQEPTSRRPARRPSRPQPRPAGRRPLPPLREQRVAAKPETATLVEILNQQQVSAPAEKSRSEERKPAVAEPDLPAGQALQVWYDSSGKATAPPSEAQNSSPEVLSEEDAEDSELERWSKQQRLLIAKRTKEGVCLVCGKKLGKLARMCGIRHCHRHYFSAG